MAYTTIVIDHETEEGARDFCGEITERFPWRLHGEKGSGIIMMGSGDFVSISDAARMALDTKAMDIHERIELAQDLLDCKSWEACLAKFSEWELDIVEGELVDQREARSLEPLGEGE